MSVEEVISVVGIMLVFGTLILVANLADQRRQPRLRSAVLVGLVVVNLLALLVAAGSVTQAYSDAEDAPTVAAGWGAFAVSALAVGLSLALLYPPVRAQAARLFPRYEKEKHDAPPVPPEAYQPGLTPQPEGTPLFPQMLNYYTSEGSPAPLVPAEPAAPDRPSGRPAWVRGFNTASMVHLVALLVCIQVFASQMSGFILGGGLEGVAEEFEGGISGWSLLLNTLPVIVLSLMGVGLGVRRGWRATARRLGLEALTVEGFFVAFGVTIVLFIGVLTVTAIWMALVSDETFDEQTEASNALADSVSTLGLAFLVAATAAIGEEIAFRGALQPVFGLWPTALLFAATHAQYTLTPASLIILGVALAFGWIRLRYNTTVAIMTHFMYNFIPLAVGTMAPDEASALLHLLR